MNINLYTYRLSPLKSICNICWQKILPIQILSFMIIFLTNTCFGQGVVQTGALDDGNSTGPGAIETKVWAVPAEQKVRPDDRVESRNLVWNEETKKINLAGAANEHVPFQVVITSSVSGSPRTVKSPDGFFIEASDLVSSKGNRVSKENIDFFLQHYIMLFATSSPAGETGYWPDAIVPVKIPFGMNAHYHVVRNRPIWVDLRVPKDIAAGKYSGTVTVKQHDKPLETLAIELEVYDFMLPDETPLITYMNIARSWLANFYHKESDSEEIEKLTQNYYDKLYENRMEPWFNDMLTPEVVVKGNTPEVSFNHERYLYYMNELKTKRVLLHAMPGNLRRQISAEEFSPEFNQIVQAYLKQVDAYFKKNGWQERLVFNSPIDEPRSLEEYEETRKWANLVKGATPDVPFLITRTPVPPKDNPEWGTFRGYVDNYSIHGNHLNDPVIMQVIREEKSRGGELTWYISCDQRYPQPNYFIDAPAMDLVMVPWITARYDMDGILYWALNFWNQTSNPWLNANTYHSGFLCSGGWVLNGEGSVWYPGDLVKQFTGQPDVDGPVSSIRFELLREGIEDYVYLSMLKELGDEEFAKEKVNNLVVDVSAFSRNVEKLYLTREAMARRIEEISGK